MAFAYSSSALRSTHDADQGVTQLGGLGVVDRHDEAAAALERNPHDDQATFFNSLHRSVTGPRLHGCHVVSPFDGYPSIIPHPPTLREPRPFHGHAADHGGLQSGLMTNQQIAIQPNCPAIPSATSAAR